MADFILLTLSIAIGGALAIPLGLSVWALIESVVSRLKGQL